MAWKLARELLTFLKNIIIPSKMKKTLFHIGAVFLMALCSLSTMAQIGSDGYYRVRNAERTTDYISIANDKFNFSYIIGRAGGEADLQSKGIPYALNITKVYLKTDIHLLNNETPTSSPIIKPAEVVYADKRNTNVNNHEYNLIAQGTSLLTLTTGYHNGTFGITFKDIYVKVTSTDNTNTANTQYTTSVELKDANNSANLGNYYFVDSAGVFSINKSYAALNAKWYVQPITYFNVLPDLEFNGKYYTTLYVPFAYTLGENINKAYVIHEVSDGTLIYEAIASTGELVPAGTPVILECNSPDEAECKLYLNNNNRPIFTAPDATITTGAPVADETTTNYSGTNILKGTYYCNADGTISYVYLKRTGGNWLTGYTYEEAVGSLNVNRYKDITSPVKYVMGINTNGKIGFVKATATNTPNSRMPANKAWLEQEGVFPSSAMPTISPESGSYVGSVEVTISSTESDAIIYYTTDGSTPTTNSLVYNGAFTVNETSTVNAIAVKPGLYNPSDVASATYTIMQPELTATPQSLTINDSGQNNTFSVEGHDLGTDNVGVTRTNTDFVPSLSATTGTAINEAANWYYTPNGGALNGSVDVTYQGRELKATTTINIANNLASTSVEVTYKPDLYLIGNYGGSGWNYANGTNMSEADGIYTTTITIPANGESYIMFARKTGEYYDWNNQGNGGNRYFFGASTDGGDWTYTGAFDTGNLEFWPTHNYKYCPIKFPQDQAGTYTVTVNANNNTFTITKVMTLADIVNDGVVNSSYTIADDILAIYIAENEPTKVYAKDMGRYRNPLVATGEQIDYVMNVAHLQSGDWDQSNWVLLEFGDDVEVSQFVNGDVKGIINGGTLTGKLTDKLNPTMQVTSYQTPDQMAMQSTNYVENHYVTANFMNTQVQTGESGKEYFFVNPKPQEYVKVNWAMYNGGTTFSVPDNQTHSNGDGLLGSFNVDWSLYPGNVETDFEQGLTYDFHAIVRYTGSKNRDGNVESGSYAVYPLEGGSNAVTSIVEKWNNERPVEVKYVNIMGQTSDKPFSGLNIVVTRYSNGTITTKKVIR